MTENFPFHLQLLCVMTTLLLCNFQGPTSTKNNENWYKLQFSEEKSKLQFHTSMEICFKRFSQATEWS